MSKTVDAVSSAASDAVTSAGEKYNEIAPIAVEESKKLASTAVAVSKEFAGKAADKTKKAVSAGTDKVKEAIDANRDGNVDIQDIIILGFKAPGIRINRSEFLRKEFVKKYPQDVINKAIAETPAKAGIKSEDVDKTADDVIQFERMFVSGISTALGVPGGAAMAATIPADITQYYGYMLRAAQELMYLYGFPELDGDDGMQSIDSETMNTLIVCLGTMYGVEGANAAIKAMAKAFANGVEKKLMKAALTKGAIYPIVKSVASWFGKKMTKEVFAGFFKKSIPVVGGVIGGGITYLSFKPCCDRLKESLQNTLLSNPDMNQSLEANIIDI